MCMNNEEHSLNAIQRKSKYKEIFTVLYMQFALAISEVTLLVINIPFTAQASWYVKRIYVNFLLVFTPCKQKIDQIFSWIIFLYWQTYNFMTKLKYIWFMHDSGLVKNHYNLGSPLYKTLQCWKMMWKVNIFKKKWK